MDFTGATYAATSRCGTTKYTAASGTEYSALYCQIYNETGLLADVTATDLPLVYSTFPKVS